MSSKELLLVTLLAGTETIQKMHTEEGLKAQEETISSV